MRYLYSSEWAPEEHWPYHRGGTVAQVFQGGGGCLILGTQGQLDSALRNLV